jgi:hypothetical protein
MWINGGSSAPSAYLIAFNTTSFAATAYNLGTGIEGFDCCTDGAFIYAICENATSLTGQLLKVTTTGAVSTLASWSLASTGGFSVGALSCIFDGTYIWVFGGANNNTGLLWRVTTAGAVTRYTLTGTLSGSWDAMSFFDSQFWITAGAASSPKGLNTAPNSSPGVVANHAAAPLNQAFGLAAYDGTSIWLASSTSSPPTPYVAQVNPSTYAATSFGTASTGDGISLVFDGTLLWTGGASVAGAASFSPASPTVVTPYTTYLVGGVSTTWGGGYPGLDSAGNMWWASATAIATNKSVVTQQLVMMP